MLAQALSAIRCWSCATGSPSAQLSSTRAADVTDSPDTAATEPRRARRHPAGDSDPRPGTGRGEPAPAGERRRRRRPGDQIARLRVEFAATRRGGTSRAADRPPTGEERRKRIERDLHDGAQQRLVSVGLALRHLQHELPAGSNGRKANELDGVVDEIARAISELRELARGVRPSQLDDGLAAALRELAGRASLPIDVYAGPERYPENIEAAAYFIACEGLTNAIKHANASTITVRAECHDERPGHLRHDDSAGGAAPSRGSGLAGLADRVEAQGGTLRLESSPAGGTNLTAVLPLAA